MPAEVSTDQRRPAKTTGTHPPEPENLPCPRCESINTKFCYYNNYNLSQPRYFCKSCRRYWTRGGTLRNIPVGGGTRKNSKRSRSSPSCSSSITSANGNTTRASGPSTPCSLILNTTTNGRATTTPVSEGSLAGIPMFNGLGGVNGSSEHLNGSVKLETGGGGGMAGTTCSPLRREVNLNESVPGTFTSLLSAGNSGLLGLSGYGLGLSNGTSAGFEDLGFGLGFGTGKIEWPMVEVGDHHNSSGTSGVHGNYGSGNGGGSGGGGVGCNTWQFSGVESGLMDGTDCFGWPDLAISTPGTGLE